MGCTGGRDCSGGGGGGGSGDREEACLAMLLVSNFEFRMLEGFEGNRGGLVLFLYWGLTTLGGA